jgi:hypothetical protein
MIRLLLVLVLGAMPSLTQAQHADDERAVRAVIQQYFKGHATADPVEMRKAFHPTAHVEGNRDGKFVSWTADEYAKNFNGKPAADGPSRRRTIDHVAVAGDAAMAGATLVHGATTFTDYFVLLKMNGEWKIANKVYSRRPTK